ncbi:MAG TPA: DUF423 domain-containing protein [Cellvibrio sp.]|nr:DUF423 domain-containing protein [Cellvibrio sp.]
MGQWLLFCAALSGFLAVGLGAFAAHGLKARLAPEMLAVFQTGVQYQMYHALALLGVVALLRFVGHNIWLQTGGVLFIIGTLLFSGSLYGLALGGPRLLGPITPLGGVCFLLGWLSLLVAAIKLKL